MDWARKDPIKTRRSAWVARACNEAKYAPRTWFVTLTYRGKEIPDYEDVKKFFKRLRKDGYEFKYMCAEEFGERKGRKHWHLLIHCSTSYTYKDMRKKWKHGFSEWKLCSPKNVAKSAGYIAKYITKGARIRASVFYGKSYMRSTIEDWIYKKQSSTKSVVSLVAVTKVTQNGKKFRYKFTRNKQMKIALDIDSRQEWRNHKGLNDKRGTDIRREEWQETVSKMAEEQQIRILLETMPF